MKKCFIGMSINKQLYFGIFGISAIFGGLCLLLILLASTKLFFSYNIKIKSIFNEIDTNIVSLNGENLDFFGQIFFNQGKYETFLLRHYFTSLSDVNFGQELLSIIDIGSEEINKHFKIHDASNDFCEGENSECYFVFSYTSNEIKDSIKKILYFLIPIINISLDTYSFNKESFEMFNKFNFYDKESNSFITYKYNKDYIEEKFGSLIPPETIMNNILISFLSTKDIIQNLNQVKINKMTNEEFFKDNIYTILPIFDKNIVIDPFYKYFNTYLPRTLHYSSFLFNKDILKDNEKVNIDQIIVDNLENYISFDVKVDYLSQFSLNFIERNGAVFIFILTNDFAYTASKSMCNLINLTNYTYSDDSINSNLNFTVGLLGVNDFQLIDIRDCFPNEKILQAIKLDNNYNYNLKILSNIYKYKYDKDANNQIMIKLIRIFSPSKFIRAFAKSKFLSNFSVYFIAVKVYNNILIINALIDRITYRSIAYITIFTSLLWLIIFICVFIKLYLVADRISSPIRKLIKNISLSQGNFNNDNSNLEKIYYREDKDINDLFQLCQRLIIGGFKKRNISHKQNKLNVYNNISKVKTNNMIINENDIIAQRNQKYNEIFEKGNEIQNKEDNFKEEIFKKYKNKELENIIRNYENIKIKKLPAEKKDELENLKTKDSEYKMFYYINKEIENFLPFNNLYKCYYDEFSKKGNKKKKK